MNNLDALHARAKALCLHGLLAHWHDATAAGWLHTLIEWEEQERARRSLERRLKDAHIGRFKPLCDFDWSWPKRCDQAAIEALMSLEFLNDATNAILVGPNGIGKSTLAQNIAHQAVIHGHTVLFTTAGQLLGDLAALDSDSTLRRRLRHYVNPTLLVIDEVRQGLHQVVLFPEGLSEFGSNRAIIAAVPEVAGARTNAVVLLLHGATPFAGLEGYEQRGPVHIVPGTGLQVHIRADLRVPSTTPRVSALALPRDWCIRFGRSTGASGGGSADSEEFDFRPAS